MKGRSKNLPQSASSDKTGVFSITIIGGPDVFWAYADECVSTA